MIWIPHGVLRLGAPSVANADEEEVAGFYMDKTEVTVAQYRSYAADTGVPALSRQLDLGHGMFELTDRHPATMISYDEALAFARWAQVDIPTEQEWEYAAKGGSDRLFPWGDRDNEHLRNGLGGEDGWEYLAPVGEYPPNSFGLHDMVGNVREWCSTPSLGAGHFVIKGGSWLVGTENRLTVVDRDQTDRDTRMPNLGFRCVWRPNQSSVPPTHNNR
jgi:formylglycine-generating enzyme required for sulfatase activity